MDSNTGQLQQDEKNHLMHCCLGRLLPVFPPDPFSSLLWPAPSHRVPQKCLCPPTSDRVRLEQYIWVRQDRQLIFSAPFMRKCSLGSCWIPLHPSPVATSFVGVCNTIPTSWTLDLVVVPACCCCQPLGASPSPAGCSFLMLSALLYKGPSLNVLQLSRLAIPVSCWDLKDALGYSRKFMKNHYQTIHDSLAL